MIYRIRLKKKVVTEGDAKVKTIQTLWHIEEISNSLCKVIIEYETVMKNKDYRATQKKMIAILQLIKSASVSLKDGIRSVSGLQRKRNMMQSLISESKAVFNVESKRSKLLNKIHISKGTTEVRYMEYLMKALSNDCENIGEAKGTESLLVRKAYIRDCNQYDFPLPLNGTHYTLLETITHIEKYKLTTKEFYNAVKKQNGNMIICSLCTLYRHQQKYKASGVLPSQGDDGITGGRSKLIPNTEL